MLKYFLQLFIQINSPSLAILRITSFNPADGSSAHSNLGLLVKGDVAGTFDHYLAALFLCAAGKLAQGF